MGIRERLERELRLAEDNLKRESAVLGGLTNSKRITEKWAAEYETKIKGLREQLAALDDPITDTRLGSGWI